MSWWPWLLRKQPLTRASSRQTMADEVCTQLIVTLKASGASYRRKGAESEPARRRVVPIGDPLRSLLVRYSGLAHSSAPPEKQTRS
jgi:hypothetical protein